MSTNNKKQKTRIVLGGLLILIGLLLPLFLVEGLLRVIGPDWLDLRMREIALNDNVYLDTDEDWPVECSELHCYMFAPNSTFQVVTQEYSHAVTIDQYGNRSNRNLETEPSTIVPILGDSFTFGLGVEDNETFVSLIDKWSSIGYMNLGIPGNSVTQHIDIVERRHISLGRPSNYVFVFFVGNDFQNILESHIISSKKDIVDVGEDSDINYYPTITNKFNILSSLNEYVMQDAFLSKLYIVQWVRHKLLMIVNQSNADLMDPIFLVIRKDKHYLTDAKQVLDNELERLNQLASKLQFEYIFVIIPDRHQIDPDLLLTRSQYYGIEEEQIEITLPNNMLAVALETNDVPYVDITPCMADREDVVSLYYLRDNHLTANGHRVAAKCMNNELEEIVR